MNASKISDHLHLFPVALFRIVDSAHFSSFWLALLGNQLGMRAKARRLALFGWNYKPAEKYCWLIFCESEKTSRIRWIISQMNRAAVTGNGNTTGQLLVGSAAKHRCICTSFAAV
jgi:hypothetical protein